MNHGSLFSGIGGFDLAARWMGWNNVFQVEKDAFCQKVLKKNFPGVNIYDDVTTFDGTKYKSKIDIISGGFPCQPFSTAGKRKGELDGRYLWPEMFRIIREIKPAFVVGENVSGLISMENGQTFERVLASLENEGYTVEPFVIPACAVEAWHRRDRLWIIAYASGKRLERVVQEKQQGLSKKNAAFKGSEPSGTTSKGRILWEVEPELARVVNGVPNRVDRTKALGNAIVPQVAYEIFKAIEQIKNKINA